jgi:hypothetical protein
MSTTNDKDNGTAAAVEDRALLVLFWVLTELQRDGLVQGFEQLSPKGYQSCPYAPRVARHLGKDVFARHLRALYPRLSVEDCADIAELASWKKLIGDHDGIPILRSP